jgi:tRNA (guanine-N7-)-methyltransferase
MRSSHRLPLEQLAPYLLEAPEPPRTLIWSAVFGNDHPVEIEVGFGKGLFLITTAQALPERNFLGIEIIRKYQLLTATRLAKRGLSNVRLARADALAFFRAFVADESVAAVHVYYPDPWWKKRHHKRRLFTGEFVEQCARVLQPAGRLHVATDVEAYFGVMTEHLTAEPRFRRLPPPDEHAPAHDLDYLTNFERKFRKQGLPVYRAVWEKA